jgi:YegS/Rv2252/BmrU family lipid kinase
MTISLIVNPSAGGGRAARTLPAVEEKLRSLGLSHRTEKTNSLEHARALARAAASAGETAVAFGGDGLIGAVAGTLNGTSGLLGVLPGGRGNDFARVLGIPLDPEGACDVLATGAPRSLDLGEANGTTFIGIASCGFDSDANRIANDTKLIRGNLVYLYGALRALLAWHPATFTIELDDEGPVTVAGYTVAVANSKAYGGGMFMAPQASLEDGLLDVITVADVSKLQFVRSLPSVFKGEHVHNPEVSVRRGATVRVSADRPFTMYADGDPIAELPVDVRALPGAVRVMVPAHVSSSP